MTVVLGSAGAVAVLHITLGRTDAAGARSALAGHGSDELPLESLVEIPGITMDIATVPQLDAMAVLFITAWLVHLFSGWQEFVAEQAAHGEPASVWGEDGYAWTWLARSFENIMSEFLQLAAYVVLTAILIFEGSAESNDSDDRLEAKVDVILSRLDELEQGKRAA